MKGGGREIGWSACGTSRRPTELRKDGQVWIGLKVAEWDVLALEDDSER